MEQPTIQNIFAPKGELIEPPKSSKPIIASSYELCLGLVQDQGFLGLDYENPYHHLRELKQLYACLIISDISQETLRWKLFPFFLDRRARQRYDHNCHTQFSKEYQVLTICVTRTSTRHI
jgi:hypothetical protein